MSGYGSRAEAQRIIRDTIESGGNGTIPPDLPRDPAAYRMATIYEVTVHSRGFGYGWGIEIDRDRFWAAVRANLRTTPEPEFRIIVHLAGQVRGRAYMGLDRRDGQITGVNLQRPGLGAPPLYARADADALVVELRKYLPSTASIYLKAEGKH